MVFAYRTIEPGQGHRAGRELLNALYRQQTGCDMPAIALADRGKPYFVDCPWHFSISHTKNHVFCVLSGRPVGIDAEETDRDIDLRLAEKILSQKEKIRWEQSPDRQAALLKLWVLKEAAGKCSGFGVNANPNQTDFFPDDPRIQLIDGCYVAIVECVL